MDKVQRMILKARKTRRQDAKYIAWATVCPRNDNYEARIMYYEDNNADGKDPDVMTFNRRNEAADYVGALAERHGQKDVYIIHFNF